MTTAIAKKTNALLTLPGKTRARALDGTLKTPRAPWRKSAEIQMPSAMVQPMAQYLTLCGAVQRIYRDRGARLYLWDINYLKRFMGPEVNLPPRHVPVPTRARVYVATLTFPRAQVILDHTDKLTKVFYFQDASRKPTTRAGLVSSMPKAAQEHFVFHQTPLYEISVQFDRHQLALAQGGKKNVLRGYIEIVVTKHEPHTCWVDMNRHDCALASLTMEFSLSGVHRSSLSDQFVPINDCPIVAPPQAAASPDSE